MRSTRRRRSVQRRKIMRARFRYTIRPSLWTLRDPTLTTSARWLGEEPIAGERILLYSEAGLGDTLQFCRYAISCGRQGATVVLEVPEALRRLLVSVEGVSQVIGAGSPLPPFNYHCRLLAPQPSARIQDDRRYDPQPRAVMQIADSGTRDGPQRARVQSSNRFV
jgi:hypothetical protein